MSFPYPSSDSCSKYVMFEALGRLKANRMERLRKLSPKLRNYSIISMPLLINFHFYTDEEQSYFSQRQSCSHSTKSKSNSHPN